MSIKTEKFWVRTLASVTVGVAAVALSGCSLLGNITGGGGGGEVVEGEGDQTDVFAIAVGDCMNDSAGEGTVSSVPTVPCSEPHDSEAYKSIIMEDGEFPGTEAIDAAGEGCLPAFETFAGISYDESLLDFSYYFPTEQSWGQGDREILCVIVETDGAGNLVQTVGSLQGAAK